MTSDHDDDDDDDDDGDDGDDDLGGKSRRESTASGSDSDGGSAIEAQLVYLRQEMDERANDLMKLQDIVSDAERYPDPRQEINRLVAEDIAARHSEMESKMESLSSDTEPAAQSNREWKQYLLNLSKAVAANSDGLSHLIKMLDDGFLKELNGRIRDLDGINNVFFEEEQMEDFEALKQAVDRRHGEISTMSKARSSGSGESTIPRTRRRRTAMETPSSRWTAKWHKSSKYTMVCWERMLRGTNWCKIARRCTPRVFPPKTN